jgi:CHASE2 domain-containing sensor protein
MADLQKRGGGYTPRRVREQRAYRLVAGGGLAGTIAVVSAILAIAGVITWGLPIVAIIVTVFCVLMFRRAVNP